MKLHSLTLHRLRMPLVSPFITSFGTEYDRVPLLVEATAQFGDRLVAGWGECVALEDPVYSSEYLLGAAEVIRTWLAPCLAATGEFEIESVHDLLAPYRGHRMAKAALEMALLDAQLRHDDKSFAQYLGVTRTSVPSGVSVGIQDDPAALVDVVAGYLDQGYRRIKLKIKPGRDIADVAAVRNRFGDDLLLQVDANSAYQLTDAPHLARLDEFGLLLIEQPLGEDSVRQHAELARTLRTPICLDESILSAEGAADAIAMGAASIINIKAGRVGGYLQARQIHDLSRANGIAVWCGGMMESGIGRAANIALAAMPGFTLPGDVSASDRFFTRDIVTEPIRMHDGMVDVPTGPGFGIELDPRAVADLTTDSWPVPLD